MKSNFKNQASKIIPAIRFGESVNWVAFQKDVSLLSAFQSSARYNFESFKLLDIVKNWTEITISHRLFSWTGELDVEIIQFLLAAIYWVSAWWMRIKAVYFPCDYL